MEMVSGNFLILVLNSFCCFHILSAEPVKPDMFFYRIRMGFGLESTRDSSPSQRQKGRSRLPTQELLYLQRCKPLVQADGLVSDDGDDDHLILVTHQL